MLLLLLLLLFARINFYVCAVNLMFAMGIYLMRTKGNHSDYIHVLEVNMPPLVLRAKFILVGELIKL